MLFNKGLALGGSVLLVSLLGQAGMVQAQTADVVSAETLQQRLTSLMTQMFGAAAPPAPVQPVNSTTTSKTTTSGTTSSSTSQSTLIQPTAVNDIVPPAPEATASGVERVFTVGTLAELRSALITAQSLKGTEIRLQPGNYGLLDWRSKRYPNGMVRIVAATSTRPVFSAINFTSSSGILVSGVQVSGTTRPLVNLTSTNNIILTGNRFTGATLNKDPWDETTTAIWIRLAKRVTVSNNIFEDVRTALYSQASSAVTVEFNTVRHVREGLNIASNSNLDIRNNHFHSFSPRYSTGEHPDAIQFWTSREKVGSSNVRIQENAMMLGGCVAVQGIFIRSETENNSTATQIRHKDFAIRRNVYYGSARNGLSVSSVDNAVVENNVVVSSPYAHSGTTRSQAQAVDERCSGALVPGILSRFGTTTHKFRGNITMILGSTDGVRTDDVVIGSAAGQTAWTDAFPTRPTADVPPLSQLVTKNPSALRTRNIGVLAAFPHGQTLSGSAAVARALSVHKP